MLVGGAAWKAAQSATVCEWVHGPTMYVLHCVCCLHVPLVVFCCMCVVSFILH